MPRRSAAVYRALFTVARAPPYCTSTCTSTCTRTSTCTWAWGRRLCWRREGGAHGPGVSCLHLLHLPGWRYRSHRSTLQFCLLHLRLHRTRLQVQRWLLSTHRLSQRWDGPPGTSLWLLTRMLTTTLCSQVCWQATTQSLLPPFATSAWSISIHWRILTGRPRWSSQLGTMSTTRMRWSPSMRARLGVLLPMRAWRMQPKLRTFTTMAAVLRPCRRIGTGSFPETIQMAGHSMSWHLLPVTVPWIRLWDTLVPFRRWMWHWGRSCVLHSRRGSASSTRWMSWVVSLDSHPSTRRSPASLFCRIELPRFPSTF